MRSIRLIKKMHDLVDDCFLEWKICASSLKQLSDTKNPWNYGNVGIGLLNFTADGGYQVVLGTCLNAESQSGLRDDKVDDTYFVSHKKKKLSFICTITNYLLASLISHIWTNFLTVSSFHEDVFAQSVIHLKKKKTFRTNRPRYSNGFSAEYLVATHRHCNWDQSGENKDPSTAFTSTLDGIFYRSILSEAAVRSPVS